MLTDRTTDHDSYQRAEAIAQHFELAFRSMGVLLGNFQDSFRYVSEDQASRENGRVRAWVYFKDANCAQIFDDVIQEHALYCHDISGQSNNILRTLNFAVSYDTPLHDPKKIEAACLEMSRRIHCDPPSALTELLASMDALNANRTHDFSTLRQLRDGCTIC